MNYLDHLQKEIERKRIKIRIHKKDTAKCNNIRSEITRTRHYIKNFKKNSKTMINDVCPQDFYDGISNN